MQIACTVIAYVTQQPEFLIAIYVIRNTWLEITEFLFLHLYVFFFISAQFFSFCAIQTPAGFT